MEVRNTTEGCQVNKNSRKNNWHISFGLSLLKSVSGFWRDKSI